MSILSRKPAGEERREPRAASFNPPLPAETGLAGAWSSRQGRGFEKSRLGLFETCANPGCGSGWLHLWRSRTVPVFEGG